MYWEYFEGVLMTDEDRKTDEKEDDTDEVEVTEDEDDEVIEDDVTDSSDSSDKEVKH